MSCPLVRPRALPAITLTQTHIGHLVSSWPSSLSARSLVSLYLAPALSPTHHCQLSLKSLLSHKPPGRIPGSSTPYLGLGSSLVAFDSHCPSLEGEPLDGGSKSLVLNFPPLRLCLFLHESQETMNVKSIVFLPLI